MPEVTYRTTMNLPVRTIWDFVKDMDHWAPMLTGYQGHEVQSETDSVWTLKGDVGILSRTVKLAVHITEWRDAERVSFTLTGLNEVVEGGGTFTMAALADEPAEAAPVPAVAEQRPGPWKRFVRWFFRAMFKRKFGTVERQALAAPAVGEAASHLTFVLRMDAGGPTAPLVNAMLEPALLPAAEDLGNKIAAHLEAAHRGSAG
ncbi:MAG: SRPBCC family protein [Deltaproteobacteria bacterium]|nr:SRPBCC family protein [Deltaproteobacteria bacterium]MCB9785094.1 SRPBCC family protein [Deltaproteobacteria bacterium]